MYDSLLEEKEMPVVPPMCQPVRELQMLSGSDPHLLCALSSAQKPLTVPICPSASCFRSLRDPRRLRLP